ncbi:hypothetical protein [Actinomadura litoris]|uniref:hypothetical protein n=1 Tax=Actinomadura litoris TaxID=2678616 RepID=UPI001FA6F422|nr:hypothetical protein [Actinomadura litoris]
MTHGREIFDWRAALSDDLAHALAHGAECALTDAAREVDAMSPGEHALVGIGFAVLAVRAQMAQTGGDVADQLSAMADDMRDLTDALVAVRRPWWRRLVDRMRRLRTAPSPSEAGPVEDVTGVGEADEPMATVTPLRRMGADDVRC